MNDLIKTVITAHIKQANTTAHDKDFDVTAIQNACIKEIEGIIEMEKEKAYKEGEEETKKDIEIQLEEARTSSYDQGYDDGIERGEENNADSSYDEGFREGKDEGHDEGYQEAREEFTQKDLEITTN
jgi:flagellar biosynthesis/type III secretory pathway protein FliH